MMLKLAGLLIGAFLLVLIEVPGATGGERECAEILIKAHREGRPIPILSTQFPEMGVGEAYAVQKDYVSLRLGDDRIAGFKAGLTTRAVQEKFGIDAPVSGVLFESGRKGNQAVVDSSEFRRLVLETEIGFVVGQEISGPLTEVQELKSRIQEVFPAIELPDLGFADMKQLKGVDIIAANVSSKQFIAGAVRNVADLDLNAIEVSLTRDGELVNQGRGSDALGDQWQAALWLVNTLTSQGYRLSPGQIIITGALGRVTPGQPGKYVADYGDFGKVTFEIR